MLAFLKLACEEPGGTEAKMFLVQVIVVALSAALILGSYVHIAQAVLKIKSMAGCKKAFGTCTSHLLVVFLFYGSAIYTYLQPIHSYSERDGKFVAFLFNNQFHSQSSDLYS
jgi:olfactory receptor